MIKLINTLGYDVWVNPNFISTVEEKKDYALLTMSNGDKFAIRGDIYEITAGNNLKPTNP